MSARTTASRVLAAQKNIATAKAVGISAALRDDADASRNNAAAWGLASLRGTYYQQEALLAFAEGAYFAKLQDLRGEATA